MRSLWILDGRGGGLAATRIVAIARADSAPVRRMVEAVGWERIIDLTFGQPRRALAILDSGHVVALSLTPEELLEQLEEVHHG